MNVEGLTNRQLLVKALQQVLRDADNTQLPGFRGGLVSDATLDLARAALGEVVRKQKAREPGQAEAEQESVTRFSSVSQ